MYRRSLLLFSLLAFALALPACAADKPKKPVIAGHISRVQELVLLNGEALKKTGALVHVGDTLSTGKDARVEVRFTDASTLVLGENGKLAVDEYYHDPVKVEGKSLISIAEGPFKLATAALAKIEERTYQVRTPLATIGIRGTTFWGGPLDGGYNVLLLEGKGVVVENEKGKVVLSAPGQGTALKSGQAPGAPVVWTPERQAKAAGTVEFK